MLSSRSSALRAIVVADKALYFYIFPMILQNIPHAIVMVVCDETEKIKSSFVECAGVGVVSVWMWVWVLKLRGNVGGSSGEPQCFHVPGLSAPTKTHATTPPRHLQRKPRVCQASRCQELPTLSNLCVFLQSTTTRSNTNCCSYRQHAVFSHYSHDSPTKASKQRVYCQSSREAA